MNRTGLGKGLGALINSNDEEDNNNYIKEVSINKIEPNINQPRKNFDDEKLKALSESIKQHGVVQPIIVNKENDLYRIVAGERRWRAARIAGLVTIPVIIKELSNKQYMEIALIENLQREDLNPIEEAEAYNRLINEYGLTQEEISASVGKSRSAIANSVRLLMLDEKIKHLLINNEITSGHARAVLSIEDTENRHKALEEIVNKNLNVRQAELIVKHFSKKGKTDKNISVQKKKNEHFEAIEEKFKNVFGTKVKLVPGKNRGKITIEYYSNQELERIIELVDTINNSY
jgi:ParB family transcriptional regulator, chromosome partitioning protein